MSWIDIRLVVAILLLLLLERTTGGYVTYDYYVNALALGGGTGSLASPWNNITTALSAAQTNLALAAVNATINIHLYPGTFPLFFFSSPSPLSNPHKPRFNSQPRFALFTPHPLPTFTPPSHSPQTLLPDLLTFHLSLLAVAEVTISANSFVPTI